jgi:hypothetical protein
MMTIFFPDSPGIDTDAARFFRYEIPMISAIITCLVCAYIMPLTPSPFPPILNPKTARLLASKLASPQIPSTADDDYGELWSPLDPSLHHLP